MLCLPELCLTGYTCGDLFLQDTLLRGAEEGLKTILEATRNLDMVAAVGLPNGIGEAVVAAVIVPMIKIAVEAVMRRSRRAPAGRAHPDK